VNSFNATGALTLQFSGETTPITKSVALSSG
jgi:hypothetical protein